MTQKIDGDNNILDIEVALKNREFEIQLFWQRANYFLVMITALGVGAFSAGDPIIGLIISGFSVFVCWLWFQTNLGSRFWQIFWENEVELLAKKYGIESFIKETPEIREELRGKISHSQKRSTFRNWIDAQVLKKPSVTHSMITLSFFAMIFWIVISFFQIYDIFLNAEGPVPQIEEVKAAGTVEPFR